MNPESKGQPYVQCLWSKLKVPQLVYAQLISYFVHIQSIFGHAVYIWNLLAHTKSMSGVREGWGMGSVPCTQILILRSNKETGVLQYVHTPLTDFWPTRPHAVGCHKTVLFTLLHVIKEKKIMHSLLTPQNVFVRVQCHILGDPQSTKLWNATTLLHKRKGKLRWWCSHLWQQQEARPVVNTWSEKYIWCKLVNLHIIPPPNDHNYSPIPSN